MLFPNISNISLYIEKKKKNQAKAKQQTEAELFLFENQSPSSSTLSFKITGDILKIYKYRSTAVHMRLYD